MYRFFQALFPTILLLFAQAASATPQDDARLITQREFDIALDHDFDHKLKSYFVPVYFKPIAGRGITVADKEAFINLIPDEVIAPYRARLVERQTNVVLRTLTPEQLATVAEVLRKDENASMSSILVELFSSEYSHWHDQPRAKATTSGSDDLGTRELEAVRSAIENGDASPMSISLSLGLAPVFIVINLQQEIIKIEKSPNNPITLAALKTEGVLSFANPVQRQTLIRELTPPEKTSGIRFIKAPTN